MHAADAAEGIDEKACAFYARVVAGEQHLMLGEAADAVPPLERAKKLASEGAMVPSLAARCDVLLRSALAQVERRPPSLEPHDHALALAHAAGDRSLEANLLRQRARDRIGAGGSVDSPWPTTRLVRRVSRHSGYVPCWPKHKRSTATRTGGAV